MIFAEMLEIYDQHPTVNVLESEYKRLLGFPMDRVLEGRSKELVELTRDWFARNGSPWIYARQVKAISVSEDSFELEGVAFHSNYLKRALQESGAESAFLVAVGAGQEVVEQAAKLWQESKPDEYFFMETFGSAVVEHLVASTGARLCQWADDRGQMVLPHYSPGYSEWDVAEQNALFRVLSEGAGEGLSLKLDVMHSGMLTPKKSLLAVFPVTNDVQEALKLNRLVPCQRCSLPDCSYRRRPYYLDTMTNTDEIRVARSAAESVLDTEARYSLNTRALRKWAESRLTLKETLDGGYDAEFSYDGTTCSNMGHPLRYLYRISLGNRDTLYTILDAVCVPDEAVEGFRRQCEFAKRGDAFLSEIEEERPLVGKPLDAILDWNRPSNPAGCYCEQSSRDHKWAIVYQSLHYALAQMEKKRHAASA